MNKYIQCQWDPTDTKTSCWVLLECATFASTSVRITFGRPDDNLNYELDNAPMINH